jgi:hypothetical protein
VLVVFSLGSMVVAQTGEGRDVGVTSAASRRTTQAGSRLALVIGIDEYGSGLPNSPLKK